MRSCITMASGACPACEETCRDWLLAEMKFSTLGPEQGPNAQDFLQIRQGRSVLNVTKRMVASKALQ